MDAMEMAQRRGVCTEEISDNEEEQVNEGGQEVQWPRLNPGGKIQDNNTSTPSYNQQFDTNYYHLDTFLLHCKCERKTFTPFEDSLL